MLRHYDVTDFNPRSHEGSDCSDCIYDEFIPISIHAPTRGATIIDLTYTEIGSISIHAPTRGATIALSVFSVPVRNFNPRSHEGSDLDIYALIAEEFISIHAPTRGATYCRQ